MKSLTMKQLQEKEGSNGKKVKNMWTQSLKILHFSKMMEKHRISVYRNFHGRDKSLDIYYSNFSG